MPSVANAIKLLGMLLDLTDEQRSKQYELLLQFPPQGKVYPAGV